MPSSEHRARAALAQAAAEFRTIEREVVAQQVSKGVSALAQTTCVAPLTFSASGAALFMSAPTAL